MKIPLDSIGKKVSGSLNTVAWQVFELTSDEKMLKDALRWSKRSQEISPDNAMLLDTYANLLYKLGQKEEAIATEEKALQFGDKEDKEGFEQTLAKMKAGEKTWK
jgi:tetratricopeptide (TPR) repeat protein